MARGLGISFEERDLHINDLNKVDEIFCTGSVMTLAPVASLEGKKVGEECPGPVTSRLMEGMAKAYKGQWPEFSYLLTYFD